MKPSEEILQSLFCLVDKKGNSSIQFEDYFQFVFLLLKGEQKKKIYFLFQLIAGKDAKFFSQIDLKVFYTKVNNTFSNEHRHIAETETARTVFKLMNLSDFSRVSFNLFYKFLLLNPHLVDLFDVIHLNFEKGKQLKMQTYLGTIFISYYGAVNYLPHWCETLLEDYTIRNRDRSIESLGRSNIYIWLT